MSDIAELERRITAALDRAGQAMDRLSASGASHAGGDGPDLAAELEAERTANAQLEERVRAIKVKQETMVAGLEADVARLKEALATRDAEVQQMRGVNAELRESNKALREANAEGVGDAHLVNSSMMSELEALRAARSADRAELDEVLSTLDSVLKEA